MGSDRQPTGFVSQRPPAECLRPPSFAIIDQWFLASDAGLCPGRGGLAQWKLPGALQGWAHLHQLHLPSLGRPLPQLRPRTWRRQQGNSCPRPRDSTRGLIIIILWVDFIQPVIALLCCHIQKTIKKRNFNIHGLTPLSHIFFLLSRVFSNEGKCNHIKVRRNRIMHPR